MKFLNSTMRKEQFTESGTGIEPERVLDINDNGEQYLKEVGKRNVYKEIQSFAEGCDLQAVLNNLDPVQVNGLMSTYQFSDIDSSYFDVSSMPRNGGELLNMVKRSENLFAGLPEDVRACFNYSSDLFIKAVADGTLGQYTINLGKEKEDGETDETDDNLDDGIYNSDVDTSLLDSGADIPVDDRSRSANVKRGPGRPRKKVK